MMVPQTEECNIVRFELRGSQNNVRARQVLILGVPARPVSGACLKTEAAMLKDCETEALRLFRLLTSQVSDVHACTVCTCTSIITCYPI